MGDEQNQQDLSKEQIEDIREIRNKLTVFQELDANECSSFLGSILYKDICETVDDVLDKAMDRGVISSEERKNGLSR